MEIKKSLRIRSIYLKAGLILFVLFACGLYWQELKTIFIIIGNRELIVSNLEKYGVFGPLVLFVVLMVQVFLAIIPGHAFIVAGGYIYGLFVGSLITLTSTVIAGQLAFILTRQFGRPVVDRFAPRKVIDYWQKLAEGQGGMFFFFSFILPIFPNDLMSFVAALGKISPKRFFVANVLGRLPCAIVITLIGSHGLELPQQVWLGLGIILLTVCLIWKKLTPNLEQRMLKSAQPIHY